MKPEQSLSRPSEHAWRLFSGPSGSQQASDPAHSSSSQSKSRSLSSPSPHRSSSSASSQTVTKVPLSQPKSPQSAKPFWSLSRPSAQVSFVFSRRQHVSGMSWQSRSPQSNWPSSSLSIWSEQATRLFSSASTGSSGTSSPQSVDCTRQSEIGRASCRERVESEVVDG